LCRVGGILPGVEAHCGVCKQSAGSCIKDALEAGRQ
jgi:bacterioferritin-associated ferredoxin